MWRPTVSRKRETRGEKENNVNGWRKWPGDKSIIEIRFLSGRQGLPTNLNKATSWSLAWDFGPRFQRRNVMSRHGFARTEETKWGTSVRLRAQLATDKPAMTCEPWMASWASTAVKLSETRERVIQWMLLHVYMYTDDENRAWGQYYIHDLRSTLICRAIIVVLLLRANIGITILHRNLDSLKLYRHQSKLFQANSVISIIIYIHDLNFQCYHSYCRCVRIHQIIRARLNNNHEYTSF